MVKIARAVKQERRRQIRGVSGIKALNDATRRRKTLGQSPLASVHSLYSDRVAGPRLIQIEVKSGGAHCRRLLKGNLPKRQAACSCRQPRRRAATQSLIVLAKQPGVGRSGDAQIFLRLLVTGIPPQRFAELDNGLRNLAFVQIDFAEVIISRCQSGIGVESGKIMLFCLFQRALCQERVRKAQFSIGEMGIEMEDRSQFVDGLIVSAVGSQKGGVAVVRLGRIWLEL